MSDQAETVTMEVPTAPLQVPEPTTAAPVPAHAEFSGKPGDFQKDLALLAAEEAKQRPRSGPTCADPARSGRFGRVVIQR